MQAKLNRRQFFKSIAGLSPLLYRLSQPPAGNAQNYHKLSVEAANWWADNYVKQAWGADTINAETGEPINPNNPFAAAIGHLLNYANIVKAIPLKYRLFEYIATHDAKKVQWTPAPMKGVCGEHIAFCSDVYWLAYELSGDSTFKEKAIEHAKEYLQRAYDTAGNVVHFSYDYASGAAEGDQFLNHAGHLIGTLTRLQDDFIRRRCKLLAENIINNLTPIGLPYELYKVSDKPLPGADIYSNIDKDRRSKISIGAGYPEIWANHPITRQEMVTDFLEGLCLAWRNTKGRDYLKYATRLLDNFLNSCYDSKTGKLYVVDVNTGKRLEDKFQFQHLHTCLLLRSLCITGQISLAEQFTNKFVEYATENNLFLEWVHLGWERNHICNLSLEPATALLYLYIYAGKPSYLKYINCYLEALLRHARHKFGFAQVRTDNFQLHSPIDTSIFGGGIAPAFILPNILKPKALSQELPDMFELYHQRL